MFPDGMCINGSITALRGFEEENDLEDTPAVDHQSLC